MGHYLAQALSVPGPFMSWNLRLLLLPRAVVLDLWVVTPFAGQTTLSQGQLETIRKHQYLHYDL